MCCASNTLDIGVWVWVCPCPFLAYGDPPKNSSGERCVPLDTEFPRDETPLPLRLLSRSVFPLPPGPLPCESANRITRGTDPLCGTTLFALTTAVMACSINSKRISAPAVVVPLACSKRHSIMFPNVLKNSLSSLSCHCGGNPLTYTLSDTTPTPPP